MDNPRLYFTVFINPKMWKIQVFEIRASKYFLLGSVIPKIFGRTAHFSKIQQSLHCLEILLLSFCTICPVSEVFESFGRIEFLIFFRFLLDFS